MRCADEAIGEYLACNFVVQARTMACMCFAAAVAAAAAVAVVVVYKPIAADVVADVRNWLWCNWESSIQH
jgi:hypothetical protein